VGELKLDVKRLSEDWVLLCFGNAICDEVTQRVQRSYEYLKEQDFVQECIPTYTDVAVRVRGAAAEWGREEWLALLSQQVNEGLAAPGRFIEIPVRFSQPHDACDLQHYAQQIGAPVDAIIAQLLAVEFRVAMIGFLPGMPYLSGLPDNLHLPRREALATALPGTFAIGGQQAGFLPNKTLTGWWRLGCTDVSVFDLHRQPNGLFNLGDRVRLLRVD
jgi:KipI family sensor histidine kinase inhibitor